MKSSNGQREGEFHWTPCDWPRMRSWWRFRASAAYLVDQVISRVPLRHWVLSFPIPLRLLFAAHPQLLAPLLRNIQVNTTVGRVTAQCARLTRPAIRGVALYVLE